MLSWIQKGFEYAPVLDSKRASFADLRHMTPYLLHAITYAVLRAESSAHCATNRASRLDHRNILQYILSWLAKSIFNSKHDVQEPQCLAIISTWSR